MHGTRTPILRLHCEGNRLFINYLIDNPLYPSSLRSPPLRPSPQRPARPHPGQNAGSPREALVLPGGSPNRTPTPGLRAYPNCSPYFAAWVRASFTALLTAPVVMVAAVTPSMASPWAASICSAKVPFSIAPQPG